MRYIEDELYQKIKEVMPIPCVDIAIRRGGKILLVKRTNEPERGSWWVPGGRIHKGEGINDAAVRIAREETGLIISTVGVVAADSYLFEAPPMQVRTQTLHVCVLSVVELPGEVVLDAQASEYMWADVHDDLDLSPYIEKCVSRGSRMRSEIMLDYVEHLFE